MNTKRFKEIISTLKDKAISFQERIDTKEELAQIVNNKIDDLKAGINELKESSHPILEKVEKIQQSAVAEYEEVVSDIKQKIEKLKS